MRCNIKNQIVLISSVAQTVGIQFQNVWWLRNRLKHISFDCRVDRIRGFQYRRQSGKIKEHDSPNPPPRYAVRSDPDIVCFNESIEIWKPTRLEIANENN